MKKMTIEKIYGKFAKPGFERIAVEDKAASWKTSDDGSGFWVFRTELGRYFLLEKFNGVVCGHESTKEGFAYSTVKSAELSENGEIITTMAQGIDVLKAILYRDPIAYVNNPITDQERFEASKMLVDILLSCCKDPEARRRRR